MLRLVRPSQAVSAGAEPLIVAYRSNAACSDQRSHTGDFDQATAGLVIAGPILMRRSSSAIRISAAPMSSTSIIRSGFSLAWIRSSSSSMTISISCLRPVRCTCATRPYSARWPRNALIVAVRRQRGDRESGERHCRLLHRLSRHKAHARPLHRLATGLSVGRIILVGLNVRAHKLRRHQANVMPSFASSRAQLCASEPASMSTRRMATD